MRRSSISGKASDRRISFLSGQHVHDKNRHGLRAYPHHDLMTSMLDFGLLIRIPMSDSVRAQSVHLLCLTFWYPLADPEQNFSVAFILRRRETLYVSVTSLKWHLMRAINDGGAPWDDLENDYGPFTHGKTEKDRKDTNLNDGIPEDRFRHRLKDADNVLWAAMSSNVVHETLVKLFIRSGIRSDNF